MSRVDFERGWFTDRHGVNWFCVMRGESICCEDTFGNFTAVSPATFERWGWTRIARK